MTLWYKIGLFSILASIFLSILLLFGNTFKLNQQNFNELVQDKDQALLWPKVQSLSLSENNAFKFTWKIKQAINSINKEFDSTGQYDNKIYSDYEISLARASAKGVIASYPSYFFFLLLFLGVSGLILMIYNADLNGGVYLKNTKSLYSAIGLILISFYIIIYFFPYIIINWLIICDPVSYFFNGSNASQWFLYGLLYTVLVITMGIRMLLKYNKSNYHKIRTLSLIFFQSIFAFLIPETLAKFSLPAVDFKNMWPLDYSFFFDYRINNLIENGQFGLFCLVWGIMLFVLAVPILTYYFGKRWYCSWVCGCGALAETLGDPFRHLSDKSIKAWKIERKLIYGILIFVIIMTIAVIHTNITGNNLLLGFLPADSLRASYGFFIGSIFSGVIGTGFYPFLGNRTWCRFGCPLAAYMGIIQRFKTRFRITTNGGQCISCGNCSTYCEQGIDVRYYAEKSQDFSRASCVGCGICAQVCPRGVLKLENKA